MIVDRCSWHARVYQWWYKKKYQEIRRHNQTNLCPYVRAVFLWSWLRALYLNGIKLGQVRRLSIYFSYLMWPATLYGVPKLVGYVSYEAKTMLWGIYLILAAIALVVSFMLGCIYLFDSDGYGLGKKISAKFSGDSTMQLLSEYARSAHDRVCPEIEIK